MSAIIDSLSINFDFEIVEENKSIETGISNTQSRFYLNRKVDSATIFSSWISVERWSVITACIIQINSKLPL